MWRYNQKTRLRRFRIHPLKIASEVIAKRISIDLPPAEEPQQDTRLRTVPLTDVSVLKRTSTPKRRRVV